MKKLNPLYSIFIALIVLLISSPSFAYYYIMEGSNCSSGGGPGDGIYGSEAAAISACQAGGIINFKPHSGLKPHKFKVMPVLPKKPNKSRKITPPQKSTE